MEKYKKKKSIEILKTNLVVKLFPQFGCEHAYLRLLVNKVLLLLLEIPHDIVFDIGVDGDVNDVELLASLPFLLLLSLLLLLYINKPLSEYDKEEDFFP